MPIQQYFTLQFGTNGYYLLIYGALFLVVILLLPRGIIPTLQELLNRYRARRSQQEEEANGVVVSALPDQSGGPAGVKNKEGINL
jgi:hypothetical protein